MLGNYAKNEDLKIISKYNYDFVIIMESYIRSRSPWYLKAKFYRLDDGGSANYHCEYTR